MAETNPFIAKSVGKADQQSKQKASAAMAQAEKARASADTESWPVGANGQPMMKITMTAAELIPTGQYANVSVGPAQITAFIDTEREASESYFSKDERTTMAKALNELAEIVEGDVVAVQRNLVMESMQDQQVSNGN